MKELNSYQLDLKNWVETQNNFNYILDDSFFKAVDGPLVSKGNVCAQVHIKKTFKDYELAFHLEGIVTVQCDRCLDDMQQPLESDFHLIVKMGDTNAELDYDTIEIPENEGVLDLSWYLYEFVALALPINHSHPAGECNPEMVEQLNEVLVNDMDEVESDTEDNEEEREVDPRWQVLQGLKDKNNNN